MSHWLLAKKLLIPVHQTFLYQVKKRFPLPTSHPPSLRNLLGIKNGNVVHARFLQAGSSAHPGPDPLVPLPRSSTVQFYRRPLPEWCIPFSSEKGKLVFKESLSDGYANIYFRLAEQFHTQDEPAYCGVSTLVMVLNSLEVDPKRVWKGVWRWYHEGMLQCCVPLNVVQENGVTLDQFVGLAVCNSLDVAFTRVDEARDIEEFRRVIRDTCSKDNRVLVCSYSRKVVGQTGDGHFSPIGAYHPGLDLVLILDVARFKYPPHWISVELLWKSMQAVDRTTNLPRGYILLQKTEEMPLLLFRMSTTFRVTIGAGSLLSSTMARFLQEWQAFLRGTVDEDTPCDSVESAAEIVLCALHDVLSALLVTDSIFTTQVDMCCLGNLSAEHRASIGLLVKSLERTEIYDAVRDWVQVCQRSTGALASSPSSPCQVDRASASTGMANTDSQSSLSSRCDSSRNKLRSRCDHTGDASTEVRVDSTHYLTLLLLCWPYDQHLVGTYSARLYALVERSFCRLDVLLQNEVRQLQLHISSLLAMVRS